MDVRVTSRITEYSKDGLVAPPHSAQGVYDADWREEQKLDYVFVARRIRAELCILGIIQDELFIGIQGANLNITGHNRTNI